MKRFSQAKFSFVWTSLLIGLVWFVSGCGGQQPAALVVTPSIGDPKVGAPSPQQPGEEIGISIEIASTGGATLSYTWTADGGEIVRGQGSPAITYRVSKDPGTYNIRVKVEWDGQSVEKVTSVKVEGAASESTPESSPDTPELPVDTPTPKPTDTPESANTPNPPTATPTPKATNTPKPTNIPRPTPTPTATIDADPTVYDNFNNPANNGKFNASLWEYWGDFPNPITQQNGVLVVSQDAKAGDDTGLSARKYSDVSFNSPTFFESKLMIDPEKHADGHVQMKLHANLPSGNGWIAVCGIYNNAWAGCNDNPWPPQEGHFYDVGGKQVEYGTWHTFRIEYDPSTVTLTYYIDGQMVGSHVPIDAEELKRARFIPTIGIHTGVKEMLIGYIDDVRIGKIGQ